MEEQILLDEQSARVLDLFYQIREVDKMIDLHRNQSGDDFMMRQYEDMKRRFLLNLNDIFSEFKMEVQEKREAA